MAKLRSVKFSEAVKAFESIGFAVDRQKGSHVSMTKKGVLRPLVIPKHNEIKIGTLMSNIRTAGITREEFEDILRKI